MISRPQAAPPTPRPVGKRPNLVTGDLVHLGKTQGDFTCVSYRSPLAKKRGETSGWLPSAALTPVGPMQSPKASDWIGTWDHPDGSITIRPGTSGKLRIRGEMLVQGRHDVYPGEIKAEVRPDKESIAFVADGSIPFETPDESNGECRVRITHRRVADGRGQRAMRRPRRDFHRILSPQEVGIPGPRSRGPRPSRRNRRPNAASISPRLGCVTTARQMRGNLCKTRQLPEQ
jgi:hypothetical protein